MQNVKSILLASYTALANIDMRYSTWDWGVRPGDFPAVTDFENIVLPQGILSRVCDSATI